MPPAQSNNDHNKFGREIMASYTLPENSHRLLKRQLKKAFPEGQWSKENMDEFIKLVNNSYTYFDEDRKLNQRAESISSKELEYINNQLFEKNEFLDSFNHGLAHDIKNHSSNLEGLVQMLKKYSKRVDEQKIHTIAQKLGTSIHQMNTILNGFIYLSRAEGRIDTQYSIINSIELKEEILLEVNYLLEESENRVEFDFNIKNLFFSPHILRIILVNLISNSIKFKNPNSSAIVKVELNSFNNYLNISVKDNGIGMDLNNPDNQIFSLFNRNADNRTIKGYGIGLYMVKKIIERNQGQIKLDSQVDVGTHIQITFPLNTN